MKERRLKSFVLPTAYCLVILVLFVCLSFIGNNLSNQKSDEPVTVNAIKDDGALPVIKEQEKTETKIIKPFTSDNVKVSKNYYDMKDSSQDQENSLIYYEKTYLQNSGILYSSESDFDVLSVADGTVTKVDKDNILGNYVEITHNSNLKTIYYGLNDIVVKKDDVVTTGMIIAKSGETLIEDNSNNVLLFEVYYNGYTMDPDYFYTLNIEDLD